MKIHHALGALVVLVSNLLMATPAAAAAEYKGTWSILQSSEPGKVRFGLAHRWHGGHSNHEADWPVSALHGLELGPAGKRDVAFNIQRDAGRFDCEGYLKNGEGAGIFTFTPDPKFAPAMRNLGFTGIDEDKQFAMAVHDVSLEFARTMKAEKLSGLDADKLIALRVFDVSPQFIREIRAEGLEANDADKLVAFRVHGVTSALVKEVRAAGLEVSEDMLIAFRVHGVSPEFIAKVDSLGFGKPAPDQLVAMRVHGVTPEFIADMRSRGLKNLSIDQLINLRVHGIE
jgi:hypothetical protein